MKAKPALLPQGIDPVAALQLKELAGKDLQRGLQEYARAVAERKPKARPAAQPPVVIVPDETDGKAGVLEEKSTPDDQKKPEKKEQKKPEPPVVVLGPPSSRAGPPVQPPLVSAPASGSRPQRRPFPPPQGFSTALHTTVFFGN